MGVDAVDVGVDEDVGGEFGVVFGEAHLEEDVFGGLADLALFDADGFVLFDVESFKHSVFPVEGEV